MAILGLLPPYALDDVKFAYRGKAWKPIRIEAGRWATF